MAANEGKIMMLKNVKRWLNQQERMDAPQVAAKVRKAIKVEHDGKDIRLQNGVISWTNTSYTA